MRYEKTVLHKHIAHVSVICDTSRHHQSPARSTASRFTVLLPAHQWFTGAAVGVATPAQLGVPAQKLPAVLTILNTPKQLHELVRHAAVKRTFQQSLSFSQVARATASRSQLFGRVDADGPGMWVQRARWCAVLHPYAAAVPVLHPYAAAVPVRAAHAQRLCTVCRCRC